MVLLQIAFVTWPNHSTYVETESEGGLFETLIISARIQSYGIVQVVEAVR